MLKEASDSIFQLNLLTINYFFMKKFSLILTILVLAGCMEILPVVSKRDIKFKGQQLNGKDWVYGHFASDSCITDSATIFKIKPETVSQFTGLLDSKGVEIWENDIVQDEYGYGKIIFRDGLFSVQFDITVIMEIDGKYLTVAGNIFDNPNLLAKR
jgi:hypothetical protein